LYDQGNVATSVEFHGFSKFGALAMEMIKRRPGPSQRPDQGDAGAPCQGGAADHESTNAAGDPHGPVTEMIIAPVPVVTLNDVDQRHDRDAKHRV
jgi:hypothetical protein